MKNRSVRFQILIIIIALLLGFSSCKAIEPSVKPSSSPIITESAPDTSTLEPVQTPSEEPTQSIQPAPGVLPDAEDITKKVFVAIDGIYADKLSDSDFYTKYTLDKGSSISITSAQDIYSIYIIWDRVPGAWQLTKNNQTVLYGENGFIHEYIELSEGSKQITINLSTDKATICDIYAFTYGTVPEWVQTWQTPYEDADMLLLSTHADDEHLYFGGMMPYYGGELGYKVQVAYLVNHWNEPYRPHELLDGLWTVGMTAYPIMGKLDDLYSDSLEHAKTIYPLEQVLDYQVELLRRFKPEVVIGHDLKGEYGHGGHMLNAYALTLAVEYANDSNKYVSSYEKYGLWNTPKLYLHLYEENKIIMNWDIPLQKFNGLTAFEMAVKGYDCHKSQHKWSFAVRQGESQYDCRWFGLYRSLVGPDLLKNDVFENIVVK